MDSLKLVLHLVVANTIWALALRALARTTHRGATSSGKHNHVEWLSQHFFCGPAYVDGGSGNLILKFVGSYLLDLQACRLPCASYHTWNHRNVRVGLRLFLMLHICGQMLHNRAHVYSATLTLLRGMGAVALLRKSQTWRILYTSDQQF